jgi:hypothetical protein
MEYILAKMLLPLLLPLILAALKTAINRFVPDFAARLPKAVWPPVVAALTVAATSWSPELFVFPGMPTAFAPALYTVASMGVREIIDQLQKAIGTKEQSTTIYGISQRPDGIQLLTPKP